jgi:23S rRNA (adenine2503-C2)-methyltransferase
VTAGLDIVHTRGDDALARVFVARLGDGSLVECVESVQPPVPRERKWVLIVSTLKGCPVGCPICDAGGDYRGRLSAAEILAQIEHLVRSRFPDGRVPVPKLKIQFARMGEPALNDAVLDVLEELPRRLDAPGLLPCLSTVAPRGRALFFERLLAIKRALYGGGRFQMQFSIHSTDAVARRALIPIRTLDLEEIAAYGARFFEPGDRKIALNFAPGRGTPLDPARLTGLFSPERFLIKLTPINPTAAATAAGIASLIDPRDEASGRAVAAGFEACGFETIVSIGALRENEIGSNCGMYVARLRSERTAEIGACRTAPRA